MNVKINPGFSVKKGSRLTILSLDNDGLPNAWEMQHFGNLDYDPYEDSDLDGLTNIEEFQLQIDPLNNDTDGDGITDGLEIALHSSPKDSSDRPDSGSYYEYDPLGRIKKIIRIP